MKTAADQAPEPVELYMKVTVADQQKLIEWAKRVFRVDHVDLEVAAGALATSFVAPFSLAGANQEAMIQTQFVGLVTRGGRKGPRRRGVGRLCVAGQS